MINRFLPQTIFILILIFNICFAQSADTLKQYDLEEVTVKSGFVVQPKTVTEISTKEISKSDANSLIELGKFIPSVKVQTNSRGENLFYIRGSGERQVSLFFDGVPLNIPWDNRMDLSLVPTEAVSQISETKGIPSIVYGANTIAGVLNVDPLSYSSSNKRGNLSIQVGENNSKKLNGFWLGKVKNISYIISLGYNSTDGYNLPKSYSNDSNPEKLRINSDKKSFSVFGKSEYNFSEFSTFSLSLSYVDAEKGVTPETDVADPRFWRYPDWKKFVVSVNGKNQIGVNNRTLFTYTLAYTKFNMQINQYSDISYSQVSEIEKNDDHVLYGRVNFSRMFGLSSIVKLSASGYNTKHYENISEFSDEGTETADPENLYEQNVYSVGGEYEYLDKNLNIILGGGFDGVTTLEAGDKPTTGAQTDYTINASFIYKFYDNYSGQFHIGRKTRFPTMRESFSGALGRFEVNPDLKAESAINSELSFSYKQLNWNSDVSIFLTQMTDGIVRTTLANGKFKRINKDKIRTYGIELLSKHILSKKVSLNFNFTYMNSFAKNDAGEYADTLEYKPKVLAGVFFNYRFIPKSDLLLEINYVGEEFGLKQGSEAFQKLPDYLITNFRIAYYFNLTKKLQLEAYLRINNIFDQLYYTQWSLPESGRQFLGGIKLNI